MPDEANEGVNMLKRNDEVCVYINGKMRHCVVKKVYDDGIVLLLVEKVFLWDTTMEKCIPIYGEKHG